MRAIEFKTKIRDNKILIPRSVRHELVAEQDKNVRIVVFVKDSDVYDDKAYRQITKSQFLKGYADSDGIYDL
jgi:ferredoxin-fold anticodon binding domain-containing protein